MEIQKIDPPKNIGDFTPEEKQSLDNFISNGCPGLSRVTDTLTFKWFELYMSGKSYTEIAQICKDKKDLIMYISHKTNWHDKKIAYLNSITSNLTQKVENAKIESTNTVATIVSSMNKYFGDKFNNYLATNDKSIIEDLDSKLLEKYYKSLEILDKLFDPANKNIGQGNKTEVNVNVGNNATVKQVDNNTIEINSNEANNDQQGVSPNQILMLLASLKKSQEDKAKQ